MQHFFILLGEDAQIFNKVLRQIRVLANAYISSLSSQNYPSLWTKWVLQKVGFSCKHSAQPRSSALWKMGHSNIWNAHPKNYGPGSRTWYPHSPIVLSNLVCWLTSCLIQALVELHAGKLHNIHTAIRSEILCVSIVSIRTRIKNTPSGGYESRVICVVLRTVWLRLEIYRQ